MKALLLQIHVWNGFTIILERGHDHKALWLLICALQAYLVT